MGRKFPWIRKVVLSANWKLHKLKKNYLFYSYVNLRSALTFCQRPIGNKWSTSKSHCRGKYCLKIQQIYSLVKVKIVFICEISLFPNEMEFRIVFMEITWNGWHESCMKKTIDQKLVVSIKCLACYLNCTDEF